METFAFSKNGNFGDTNEVTTFEKIHYTYEDIAMRYLPSIFGLTIANENLTYGQLATITRMVNNGWTLLPSFYKTVEAHNVEKIAPNLSCFSMWCDNHGTVTQYLCSVNYDNGNVELFDSNKKLADYQTVDAMFQCMPQLFETEPLTCVEYNDSFIANNVSKFDLYGFDDEIFLEENYVFGDMDSSRCEFFLDKTKCYEIKFEKGE